MASLLSASFLCLFLVSAALAEFATFQYQPFDQPQGVGFDQSLSYSGSSGSGSGSVPTVPSVPVVPNPGYGSSPTPSGGSGSVPSGGGSVPTTDPTYGGGSGGGGGIPSVDPSGPSGGGSIPSVDPSGPSGGGSPLGGGPGGLPPVGGGPGGLPPVGGGTGGFPTVPSTGGSPMPSGCSCDFWAAHVNSWPDPMQIISTVSAIFGGLASNTFGPHVTLLSALENTRQDPYSQLLRQGTAAMLNAYSQPRFAYTPQAVRTHFNAALVSPQAAVVQATKFSNANRGYGTATLCT